MIIGLTGPICAGKDSIVQYLRDKGFEYFSLSNMIRDEAAKLGMGRDRESLQKVGDMLKQRYGDDGVFARRIVETLQKQDLKKAVVESIRHPAEVAEFRKASEFVLLAVDARQRLRFARSKKRGLADDVDNFEEFRKFDEKEVRGDPGSHQKLKATMALADFTLDNNGTLKELHNQIDRALKKALKNLSLT